MTLTPRALWQNLPLFFLFTGCSAALFHTERQPAKIDAPGVGERIASPSAATARGASSEKPGRAASNAAPSDGELEPPPLWPEPSDELIRVRRLAEGHVLARKEALEAGAVDDVAASSSPVGSRPLPAAHVVPIENDAALAHFHEALARLAVGEDEDGKVRILAYGASHTQADIYPGYLRAYLQGRFGDGGRGFVLLGRVNRWHRTLDVHARQHALEVHHARYKLSGDAEPLGLFGAALVGRNADGYAEVVIDDDSPNTRFEIEYFAQPRGGSFRLQLDGKPLVRVSTAASRAGGAYYAFSAAPGAHTLRVQLLGDGPVRLFGIVAETEAPGVVLDTLGIGGSRMADSLRWQDDSFVEAVRHRNPDLVTFAYGTNEAFDGAERPSVYEADVRAVLARLRRAAPAASCLFIAPFDVASSARARLVGIIAAQRRLSEELGCAFWDGYAFMGGAGTIRTWAASKPPLASSDLIHLTRLGYVRAAAAIGDALMRRYDLSHERQGEAAGAARAPSAPSPEAGRAL